MAQVYTKMAWVMYISLSLSYSLFNVANAAFPASASVPLHSHDNYAVNTNQCATTY